MTRATMIGTAAVLSTICASHSAAQCEPTWSSAFSPPGVTGDLRTSVVFDDGSGPALYIGGRDMSVGGHNTSIARWDGRSWTPLLGAVGSVYAFGVFDDDGPGPNGPELYAAGELVDTVTPSAPPRILRWTGSEWVSVPGTSHSLAIHALIEYDDGSGPALYAGGSFTNIGGQPIARIARRDGQMWSSLGSGIPGFGAVLSLATFDDDQGSWLFVGGQFSSAGGFSSPGSARWNAGGWSPLSTDRTGAVRAMCIFDDGTGPTVYGAARSRGDDGQFREHVVRWRDGDWAPVGESTEIPIYALASGSGLRGPALFAGGGTAFSPRRLGSWDGLRWHWPAQAPTPVIVQTLASFAGSAASPSLFIGGDGGFASGVSSLRQWVGGLHQPVGGGLGLASGSQVDTLASVDWGEGPRLVVTGTLAVLNEGTRLRTAVWDGLRWQSLPFGPTNVRQTLVYDDGTGAALYAVGRFAPQPGGAAPNIARWDGSRWQPVGDGVGTSSTAVNAAAVLSSPTGDRLYVGGTFLNIGEMPISRIAGFDGESWVQPGDGVGENAVLSMSMFDLDGPGPAAPELFVGGTFVAAGGLTANVGVGRWSGSEWLPTGQTGALPQPRARALLAAESAYPGASTYGLYAAGPIADWPNDLAAVCRWTGSAWTRLGGDFGAGPELLSSLAAMDVGPERRLFAAGNFTEAGGVQASRIAAWDGTAWTPLGAGVDNRVRAMAVHHESGAPVPTLFVGGQFRRAGGHASFGFSSWGPAQPTVILHPAPGRILSGSATALSIYATGAEPLVYQWRRDGVPLQDGDSIAGATTPQLSFSQVAARHAGEYDCLVTDACGQTVSLAATLAVVCAADWDEDGVVGSRDISAFINDWIGSVRHGVRVGDFNQDGVTDSGDLSAFIGAWLGSVSGC